MDFLSNFFLPPSGDHLHLIKYIILLIYFIHIPFISLVIGGTFFSLFFRMIAGDDKNSFQYRISADFVKTLVFRKTAGIFLGVLPLLVVLLIEGQLLYDANIQIVKFMLYTTVLVAVGITFVYFYEYTFRNSEIGRKVQLFAGGMGLLFLFAGYFIFSVSATLILYPGFWGIVTTIPDMLFSWNVIARFLHFITAAFAVSGAALIFFFFNWGESRRQVEPAYADYVRKVGGGIALAFVLFQPVLLFWNLITISDVALSATIYALTVFVLFLIMFISLTLYRLLRDAEFKLGTNVFVLFVVTLIVMIVNDHLARENATENHSNLLTTRASEVAQALRSEREQAMAESIEPDPELGRQIYQNQCSSCHRFDSRLVGPPYNDVLPKYADNKDELADFIRNPRKINPDYPAMPNLGLTEKEIKSVIAYLYQRINNNE